MHAPEACLELIKEFEGCRLEAYPDQVGVLTIGYGHTGPEVTAGLQISQAWADQLLTRDVARAEAAVRQLVGGVLLTQGQFDALVSFVFNLGAGALAKSTLLKLLKAGELDDAAAEFLKWDHAGGQIVVGLFRRRAAERMLFLGRSR